MDLKKWTLLELGGRPTCTCNDPLGYRPEVYNESGEGECISISSGIVIAISDISDFRIGIADTFEINIGIEYQCIEYQYPCLLL